jgi:hypothetical protein
LIPKFQKTDVTTNVREIGCDEQMINDVPQQKFQSLAYNTGKVPSEVSNCESESINNITFLFRVHV